MIRTYIVHALAFFIAPLFAGLGTGLSFYLRHPNDFLERIETKGIFFVLGPNIYVTSATFGVVICLGVPGYLILKKLSLAKGPLLIAYAALVGYSLSFIFSGLSSDWRTFVFPSIIVSTMAVLILWLGNLTRPSI